jgi:acyl dehydratase
MLRHRGLGLCVSAKGMCEMRPLAIGAVARWPAIENGEAARRPANRQGEHLQRAASNRDSWLTRVCTHGSVEAAQRMVRGYTVDTGKGGVMATWRLTGRLGDGGSPGVDRVRYRKYVRAGEVARIGVASL